eukprot:Gb_02897 [translate_table: standard]
MICFSAATIPCLSGCHNTYLHCSKTPSLTFVDTTKLANLDAATNWSRPMGVANPNAIICCSSCLSLHCNPGCFSGLVAFDPNPSRDSDVAAPLPFNEEVSILLRNSHFSKEKGNTRNMLTQFCCLRRQPDLGDSRKCKAIWDMGQKDVYGLEKSLAFLNPHMEENWHAQGAVDLVAMQWQHILF